MPLKLFECITLEGVEVFKCFGGHKKIVRILNKKREKEVMDIGTLVIGGLFFVPSYAIMLKFVWDHYATEKSSDKVDKA